MTVAYISPTGKFRAVDNNGAALVGGKVYTYAAGTTTPIATYNDSTGITANANPVILNSRGEADIWILPNTGYKLVLQDSTGNVIWTEDNVYLSQLLTLYGGVDTGSANAYILSANLNFTSYTDGIQLTWIPSNSNTLPSTINIDPTGLGSGFLGAIPIVNSDLTALFAGEIISGQPAQILIKGGNAILLNPAVNQSIATFTPTWLGVSPLGAVNYTKVGRTVTVNFPSVLGSSSGTTFVLTGLPASITPSSVTQQAVPIVQLIDNNAIVSTPSVAVVNGSLGYIYFYKDYTLGSWTASGNKGFNLNSTITYVL